MNTDRYRKIRVNSGVEAVLDSGIEMKLDEYGQYAPVRVGPVANGILDKARQVDIFDVTASNQTEIATKLFGHYSDLKSDGLLGFYHSLYVGHVTDELDRLNSTSGGMTTWILCELLKRGMVDGVIHMRRGVGGVGPLFEYGISRTESEIREAAKTKYYPGEVSCVLNDVRNNSKGQRFALVGIPEIVAEVRLLGEILPEIKELIPYRVGLLCGHQKSTKYLESMAWQLGFDTASLTDADFRSKQGKGRADQYLTRVTGIVNGVEVSRFLDPKDSLVANWSLGFFKSDFSDFTDDVFNETADVTFGDAWLPEYSSDYRGRNVVIVRNPTIAILLREGVESSSLSLDEVDVETVLSCQKGLIRHSNDELGYRLWRLKDSKISPPRTRVRPSRSNIRFLRKLEQRQRMANGVKSRNAYRKAEREQDFAVFRRFAMRRILMHRFVRVIELATRRRSEARLVKPSRCTSP